MWSPPVDIEPKPITIECSRCVLDNLDVLDPARPAENHGPRRITKVQRCVQQTTRGGGRGGKAHGRLMSDCAIQWCHKTNGRRVRLSGP